jgi:hypothetical protein
MSPQLFCQSCTLPIDTPADCGTEKDGTPSQEYCKYCYQDGTFTDPGLTLAEMESIVTNEMKKQHLPDLLLQKALGALPYTKRWNKNRA